MGFPRRRARIAASAALLGLSLVAACSEAAPERPSDTAATLEAGAIGRGIIRDPAAASPVGLYAREGDRLCVVDTGDALKVGGFVDFGDGIGCSAAGSGTRGNGTIAIDWSGGCRFDATFDGDRIALPGGLPDACRRLCTREASFAGLEVSRLGEASEANALRDPAGRSLCRTPSGTAQSG